MDEFESKLSTFIHSKEIPAAHLFFQDSCHSVEEAAKAANTSADNFVKNICLIDSDNRLIVAIVKGRDRASTSKIGRSLDIEQPRTATPEEIIEKTGYPCGGVPSFGYEARFLIDSRVMEMESVYTGGGSEHSLVKITPMALQSANQGQVIKIRK